MRRNINAAMILLTCLLLAGCTQAQAEQREEFSKPPSDSGPTELVDRQPPAAVDPAPEPEAAEEEAEEPYEEAYEPEYYEASYGYYEPTYGTYSIYNPALHDAYNADGPSATMPGYFDGYVETYYDASAHFMAGEWMVDGEGFYHDSEGRYVIGVGIDHIGEMPYGTEVETGKGTAVVYDYGYGSDVHDFAVAGSL